MEINSYELGVNLPKHIKEKLDQQDIEIISITINAIVKQRKENAKIREDLENKLFTKLNEYHIVLKLLGYDVKKNYGENREYEGNWWSSPVTTIEIDGNTIYSLCLNDEIEIPTIELVRVNDIEEMIWHIDDKFREINSLKDILDCIKE